MNINIYQLILFTFFTFVSLTSSFPLERRLIDVGAKVNLKDLLKLNLDLSLLKVADNIFNLNTQVNIFDNDPFFNTARWTQQNFKDTKNINYDF
jgi:hypothetical protein